jgi:heterodisulfide reductase subunit A-like polyferredoxin
MTTQAERDALADMVLEMLKHRPKGIYGKPDARVAIVVAASAVRRGRHLTEQEQMVNLANGMEEPIEGDTPEDIASSKALADRIRRAAGVVTSQDRGEA